METVAAVDWLTRDTAHFCLHYRTQSYAEQNLATALTAAERTYRSLNDALHVDALVGGDHGKIDLYLVEFLQDPADPDRALTQGARVVDGAIRQVFTPESPGSGLDRALLGLLAQRGLAPGVAGSPFFLDGLAAYLAGGRGRAAQRAL